MVPENGLNILLWASARPRRAFHGKFMCKLKHEWCVRKWKKCILIRGIRNEFIYGFPLNFYVAIRCINLHNLIHDVCNCALFVSFQFGSEISFPEFCLKGVTRKNFSTSNLKTCFLNKKLIPSKDKDILPKVICVCFCNHPFINIVIRYIWIFS